MNAHPRSGLLLSILLLAHGMALPAAAAGVAPRQPRIVPVQQLKDVLATLHGEVIVQFTSEDPKCGYCVRGNRDMPLALAMRGYEQPYLRVQWSPWRSFPPELAQLSLARPLEGIPCVVVFKDGRETERINGADPWTQALTAPPVAAPKRDPAAR